MVETITISDIPDDTLEELTSRAASKGETLEEYIRKCFIDLANQVDPDVLMAQFRERKEHMTDKLSSDDILRFRDEDRR